MVLNCSRLSSIIVISIFIVSIQKIYAQDKRDVGIQLGGTYYYGDFNENAPFYKPSFGLGVIFRYNLNNYYSLRASALYGNISGSYTGNAYLPSVTKSGFSKTFLNAEFMAEFNFVSFNPITDRKGKLSPFVNLGIGVSQIGGTIIPNIPFGLGLKYTSGQRHTLALEWQFHKTFSDNIDNYSAPNDGKSVFIHNNDWTSFIGLIYTYRLYNNGETCPAYK